MQHGAYRFQVAWNACAGKFSASCITDLYIGHPPVSAIRKHEETGNEKANVAYVNGQGKCSTFCLLRNTMVQRVNERVDIKPERLLGDTEYGTAPMFNWMVNEKQIKLHVRVWNRTQLKDKTISSGEFVWDKKGEGISLSAHADQNKTTRSKIQFADCTAYRRCVSNRVFNRICTSGMRSLYLRTAKDFVKILDTAVPQLQLCLKDGDMRQAMMRLHSLKGNAGTLGAMDLAVKVAMLEKLCTTGAGMHECEAGLAQFEVIVCSTKEKMLKAIALFGADTVATKAVPGNVISGTVGQASLNALKSIAALAKAADMEVLQQYAQTRVLIAEFPTELVDALDVALQDLDLESAASLCEMMLIPVKD